jgi:hypothetical protein
MLERKIIFLKPRLIMLNGIGIATTRYIPTDNNPCYLIAIQIIIELNFYFCYFKVLR